MHLSKLRQRMKSIGFKTGGQSPTKGKRFPTCRPTAKKYARLCKESFESRIKFNTKDETLTVSDADGSTTNLAPLRPLSHKKRLIDEYTVPDQTTDHPDLLTHRLYCPKKVQDMFNSEIKQHCVTKKCIGDLVFDNIASRQWGLAWWERLKCTHCKYVSAYYKLYTEVDSKGRGRKAATPNVGVQLGLMTTQTSNTGARRILMNAGIVPPSKKSMQHMSNKVGKCVQDLNVQNMHEIRESLVAENEKCGYKSKSAVRIESDTCYNNPLFNTESTPFQAGTIAATTVCENNTRAKRVIGCHVASKLCPYASKLRNRGEIVKCPNHPGLCTANLDESEPIGNEAKFNELAARQVTPDLNIVCHTSDGDSRAHSGIEKAQGNAVLSLKDLRHLGNTLRRQINKAPFSATMFSGRNKANLRNRFALSVKARCLGELKKAHKHYNQNIEEIQAKMPNIISAIVLCFRGYCGHMCKKYSLVCAGDQRQASSYLPPNSKLKMTGSDVSLLKSCVEILLGKDNLTKTKFQTSTQKCEAVNRAYHAVMPKNVTFPRNCHGRIHGQVLRLNNGHADSTILKAEANKLKHPRGSAVVRKLCKMDKDDRGRTASQYIARVKASRYSRRKRQFSMHAKIHYAKGISDPKPDFRGLHINDHNYA